MIQEGLNVTINTDDPSISKINLSSEYQTVNQVLGIPIKVVGERVTAAAQGAFLPADLRTKLGAVISSEFAEMINKRD